MINLIEEEVFRQANYDAKDEPETLDTIANLLHILLVPMNESIESITNLKKSAELQINKKDIHIMHASTGSRREGQSRISENVLKSSNEIYTICI